MVSSRGPGVGAAADSADADAASARFGIGTSAATLRRRAEWTLAALCLIWGSSFVVVQKALSDCSPLIFLALRFAVATVTLAIVLRGGRWPSQAGYWQEWKAGLWAGLFLFSGFLFQTEGLRYTSATNAAFLTGMNVVLVPVLASLVYRQAPQASETAGILLAAIGMALLTLNGPLSSVNLGDILSFLGALGFSAHVLVLSHYGQRPEIRNLALLQVLVVALLSAATFSWAETPVWRPTPEVGIAVAWTAVAATALAFTGMVWAQRHTTASRAALMFSLEPVFAALTSYLVLGEKLTFRATGGALLILAGILVVELKPIRMGQHPSS